MRSFSRQAYEHGVVIVRCPACDVRHLVADRKGWFGDRGSVEDFLKGKGKGWARGRMQQIKGGGLDGSGSCGRDSGPEMG